MDDRRDPRYPRDQVGRSRFAQRGVSHEERMAEDDSAQRFPGEAYTRQDARYDRERGYYGSGGSYGYGGGFEHGGERGYDPPEVRGRYGRGGEEFYETTGGFGYDVSAYGREGLGYPGREEDRYGSRGTAGERRRPQPHRDDPRSGYTQDSGYAQSGGAHREHTGEGGGFRSPNPQSLDRQDHEQRFFGQSSGQRAGRGRFYGRTPRGYTRSDQRIHEDVCDRLSHGHVDPSDVSVKVEGGMVTLDGYVDSRADKFEIEEIADSVLGVKEVDNRVRVRRAADTQEDSAWTPSKQGMENAADDKPNPRTSRNAS